MIRNIIRKSWRICTNLSNLTKNVSFGLSEKAENSTIITQIKMSRSYNDLLEYIKAKQGEFYPMAYSAASQALASQLHNHNIREIKKNQYMIMRGFYQKLKELPYKSYTLIQLFNFCKLLSEFQRIEIVDKHFYILVKEVTDNMMFQFEKTSHTLNLDILCVFYRNYCKFDILPVKNYESIARAIFNIVQRKQNKQLLSLFNILQVFQGIRHRSMLLQYENKLIDVILYLLAQNVDNLQNEELVKLGYEILQMNLLQKFKINYLKHQQAIITALQKRLGQIKIHDCCRLMTVSNYNDQSKVLGFYVFQKLMNILDENGCITDPNIDSTKMLHYFIKASQKHKLKQYKQNKQKFFLFLKKAIIQSQNNEDDYRKVRWELSKILKNQFFSPEYITFLQEIAKIIDVDHTISRSHIELLYYFTINNIKVPENWFSIDLQKINLNHCSMYAIAINQQKKMDGQSLSYDNKLAELDRLFQKIYTSKDLFCTLIEEVFDEDILARIHKLYGCKYNQIILKHDDDEISIKNIKRYHYYYILRFIASSLHTFNDTINTQFKLMAMKVHMRKLGPLKLSNNVLIMLVHTLPQEIELKNKNFLRTTFELMSIYTQIIQSFFYFHSKGYHYYSYWEVIHILINKTKQIINMGEGFNLANFLLKVIYLNKQNNFSNEIQYRKFISSTLLKLPEYKSAFQLNEFVFKEALRLNLLHKGLQKTVWPHLKSNLRKLQIQITQAKVVIQNYTIPDNYEIKSFLSLPVIFINCPQSYLSQNLNKIMNMISLSNYKMAYILFTCFDLNISKESKEIFFALANKLNQHVSKLQRVDVLGVAASIIRNCKRFEAQQICRSISSKLFFSLSQHLAYFTPQSHAKIIYQLAKLNFSDENYMKKLFNWISEDQMKVSIIEDIISALINANHNFSENQVAVYFNKTKQVPRSATLMHFLLLQKYIKPQKRSQILASFVKKIFFINIFYFNHLKRNYPNEASHIKIDVKQIKYTTFYMTPSFAYVWHFFNKFQKILNIKFVQEEFYEKNHLYRYKDVYVFFLFEYYAQSTLKVALFTDFIVKEKNVPKSKILHINAFKFDESQVFKQIIQKLNEPISKQKETKFLESINKDDFHKESVKTAELNRIRIGSISKQSTI